MVNGAGILHSKFAGHVGQLPARPETVNPKTIESAGLTPLREENQKEQRQEDKRKRRKKNFRANLGKKIQRKKTQFQTASFPLFSFRRWQKDDWQVGISALAGRPWARFKPLLGAKRRDTPARFTQERRLALDTTKFWEPLTLRAEISGGTDNGRGVWGGVVLADYALLPKLDLNTRYAYWHRDGDSQSVGAGLSYNVWRGLFLCVANNYEFGKREKNAFTTQIYFEFSHRF